MSEIDHYTDIGNQLKILIEANLEDKVDEYDVRFRKHTRLSEMLQSVGQELESEKLLEDSKNALPLDLDIVVFVYFPDTDEYEKIIVEVKDRSKVGLMNFSQLTGYNLVSKTRYGLLVNVDGGMSSELQKILEYQKDLSSFSQKTNESEIKHEFGVFKWETSSKKLVRTGIEPLNSIPKIAEKIASEVQTH